MLERKIRFQFSNINSRKSENDFTARLTVNFKVFTDSYTSRVTNTESQEMSLIKSQTDEESMFRTLTSQWKILKQTSPDFQSLDPFFGNNSLLDPTSEDLLKTYFPEDETLIDYAIQFEFLNPVYNVFSNQVKHLIAHFTLSGMVRQSKLKQLSLIGDLKTDHKLEFSESRNVSQQFATEDKEMNRFHWKSLVKDFIYGNSVFENDEDSRRFLQLLQHERAFQEKVMQVFELSDPRTDVDFVTFYLQSLYFDLQFRRP